MSERPKTPAPERAVAAPAPQNHGLRVGAVSGVPLYLSASWFVIAAIIVLMFGPDVGRALPRLSPGVAYLVAFAYALLLAVSVLCHEAAHAVVARRVGYAVQRIVVNLWGGHTAFSTPAPTPGRSALVSVSGPLANAGLALAGAALLPYVGPGVPHLLVLAWTISNAFVALFNLLPGLPLDGGFLVEAAIWKATGRRSAGLVAAGWGGRLVTAAGLGYLVLLPLAQGRGVDLWSVAWIAFLGAFLWAGASASIDAGRNLALLERVQLRAVLRPAVAVPADAPAAEIPQLLTAGGGAGLPVVVDGQGHPLGLVDPGALHRLDGPQAPHVPVAALLLAQPPGWLAPLAWSGKGDVGPFLAALAESPYGVVVLTDDGGRPVGALTSGDVERAASMPPAGDT